MFPASFSFQLSSTLLDKTNFQNSLNDVINILQGLKKKLFYMLVSWIQSFQVIIYIVECGELWSVGNKI